MHVRNFLKPGHQVYPIPIGTLMTIQYNVDGNVERVYLGVGDQKDDVTSEVMIYMIENQTIPAKLNVAGGTTFVHGVLYTGQIPKAEMDLKEFQYHQYTKYRQDAKVFNFFAFHIDCTATRISGGLSTQSTLAMNRFKTLNIQMVPANPTDETVMSWISGQYWNFVPGICMGFWDPIEDDKYTMLHVQIIKVKDVEKLTDDYGYVKANIKSTGGLIINYDYSDIVRNNVQPGDILYLNYHNKISYVIHKKNDVVPDVIACDFCGRRYKVPAFGDVYCPDEHCLSRMYPRISDFIHAMVLPYMDYSTYKKYADSGKITSLPDIMLLDEYKNVSIDTTFDRILRALIPVRFIRSTDVFTIFTNAVSNNLRTFIFYVDHPDKIGRDLSINHPDLNRLVMWLSDDANASDLKTMVQSSQFNVTKKDIRFDAPPIFRNKKICITGNFIHGDMADIVSILRSYAAEVVTALNSAVSFVITGDTGENISGEIVQSARAMNIPVYKETEFFQHYQIDDDIRNLV